MRLAAALIAALALAPAAAADPARVGYPASLGALGDSITRAFDAGRLPFREAPSHSWSTGSDGGVRSIYSRLLERQPSIRGKNANVAQLGARAKDLAAQASRAVAAHPDLVTVLIGANDVCRSNLDSMTPVDRFRSEVDTAVQILAAGAPDARIQMLSVPDVYRLWAIYRGRFLARFAWDKLAFCPVLLDRPAANTAADAARRARVRERTIVLNRTLAEVCETYVHCRFDGNAIFNTPFVRSDVSNVDYFHPSSKGQAKLAAAAWAATFDFGDRSAPVSAAAVAPGETSSVVTLSAHDDAGVAGLEYRLDSAPYVRYVFPISLSPGQRLVYRAVDVNGNVEATHVLAG
jgi:lysophospholipase L1-like esterase